MKFVSNIYILFLVLAFILFGCDSGDNRKIETLEKEFIKDSNVNTNTKTKRKVFETKDILVGIWLKPIDGQKGEEGMNFQKDYKFSFVNNYISVGDTWDLIQDTVIIWSHNDMYPDPESIKYIISELNDSVLVLSSTDSVKKHREIYRKQR